VGGGGELVGGGGDGGGVGGGGLYPPGGAGGRGGGGNTQSLISLFPVDAATAFAAATSDEPSGQPRLPPAVPTLPPPAQYAFAGQSAGTSGAAAGANQPGCSTQFAMLLAFCAELDPTGQGLMPLASGLAAVPTALTVPTRPEPGQ
jgi:hypothetical protein